MRGDGREGILAGKTEGKNGMIKHNLKFDERKARATPREKEGEKGWDQEIRGWKVDTRDVGALLPCHSP